jgi:amino acid transporter
MSEIEHENLLIIDNDENDDDDGDELIPTLGLIDCINLTAGMIIGSGIFVTSGSVLENSGQAAGLSLCVWILAGLVALSGALVYAELGAALPSAGGSLVYLQRAFSSKLFPFLNAWSLSLVVKPSSQAIIALVFARYLVSVFGGSPILNPLATMFTALAAVVAICGFNLLGARSGANVQRVLVACKLAAVLLVLGAGVVSLVARPSIARANFAAPFDVGGQWSPILLGYAVISANWAYDGYDSLATVASEVRRPERNLVLGTALGTGATVAIYVLMNCAYLCVMPIALIVTTPIVGVECVERVFGAFTGNIVMPLLIACSALGSLNASTLTGARTIYAASKRGIYALPSLFARVSPRTGAPALALLLQLAIACSYLLLVADLDALVGIFGVASLSFYALTAVALLVLRWREPALPRPFRAPLAFVLFYLLVAVAIVGSMLVTDTRGCLITFTFIYAAVPIYYLFFGASGNMLAALFDRVHSFVANLGPTS